MIFFLSVLAFFALVLRLYNIQIKNHERFKYFALRQQFKNERVKAERGAIYDRRNNLLAYTRNDVSFYVDNRMSKAQVSDTVIAEKFSKVFGKDVDYYLNLLESPVRRVCLERKVPRDFALKLSNFIVDRLYYEEDYTRVYPYGSLAAHVIGFVDRNLHGKAGVEKEFDVYLAGKDGKMVIERDVAGRIVSVDQAHSIQPQNGFNVVLTIDKEIQQILESELLKGLRRYEGKAAVGIILDPSDGKILALADLPNYDPANYNRYDDEARRNRAVTDTYEPGSTMKSIFLAMLFQEKLARENEMINTENGKYRLFRRAIIRDTHPFKRLTVKEILEHSSNIGVVKLSERISKNLFYKYLRDFGFGNRTGIEMPGEAPGKLKKPERFTPISKAFMAHGYEISVTPIQLAMAYAALINGGNLYKPEIVEAVKDENGKEIKVFQPMKIRQVISKEISDEMRKLMVGVVENGTGVKAQLSDMRVGGKTGTSQKLINNSYSSRYYNSSFVGFFPAAAPKYLVYVLVDSPLKGRYGGQVAAPIFRNIAERIIKADLSLSEFKEEIHRKKKSKVKITKAIAEAINTTDFVAADPANPTAEGKFPVLNERKDRMPNLFGVALRRAISKVSGTGLKLKIVGRGKVIWQSIPPGSRIRRGQKLILKCGGTR